MIAAQTLSDVIDASQRDEQRTALRCLLMHPVLFSAAAAGLANSSIDESKRSRHIDEGFRLVRRHQAHLTAWLARYTGWTLILRSSSARLVKRVADLDDATRAALDPSASGGSLSKSRYALWCLALAVLHDEGRQTTLQRIAERVARLADSMPELAQAGFEFDLKSLPARRSLVCVLRLLLASGVLRRIDGDETKFAESSATDCLYNIDCGLLTDILHAPGAIAGESHRSDSTEERLTRFFHEHDGEALRPREIEHRLIGRLLDNPVLYYDSLTEREFQYWQSQRSRLLQVIEDAVGLVAEVRAEGVALLDPLGDLTDAKMPESGTIGHASLLIAEFLADEEKLRKMQPITLETLTEHLAALAQQHRSHWRKNITDASQLDILLAEVLERLEMLGMIRRRGDSVQPLPAIHRFAVEASGGRS